VRREGTARSGPSREIRINVYSRWSFSLPH
jgi:hypothetical protein